MTESDAARVKWVPDVLRPEEADTILRFYALTTHEALRREFSEQLRASIHSHSIAVENILNRVMLGDGRLVIDGFDYNYTDEAQGATSLSDLFAIMLEPLFETRFSQHPYFAKKLGADDAATMVPDLHSGATKNLPEVQEQARAYGIPLGIAAEVDGVVVPEATERLLELPLVKAVMNAVDSEEGTVSIDDIASMMRQSPFGLVREGQHLLLSALVAQRQIEFVTSHGDRINQRSLDLQIIWDDIIGVARPAESKFAAKKLVKWARILTGNDGITAIDGDVQTAEIRAAFRKWVEEWNHDAVLERFDHLPDEVLTTRMWKLAEDCRKTLSLVADSIDLSLSDEISVEECLDRIADAFADSPDLLRRCTGELLIVDHFIKGTVAREEINAYLSLSEATDDPSAEELREKLYAALDAAIVDPSDSANRETGYAWDRFHKAFREAFVTAHNDTMRSHKLKERVSDILRSDQWWELQMLASIPQIRGPELAGINAIKLKLSELGCDSDVRGALVRHPYCDCSFRISRTDEWRQMPDKFAQAINAGLETSRSRLASEAPRISPYVDRIAARSNDPEIVAAGKELSACLKRGAVVGRLSNVQINLLQASFREIDPPTKATSRNTTPNYSSVDPSEAAATDEISEVGEDAVFVNA